jgi:beta-lactamase superfamily II metal-dependent hydrolase
MQQHVAATKQHRKDLDEVLQRIKRDSDHLYTGERAPDHPVRASRERSIAVTKLQEAIMWLGMDLKALNTPNPYPESYNPASPAIEPTADGLRL